MGELRVGGRKAYYAEEVPSGEPKGTIVFVHGAGGYWGKWRHQLPAMAAAGWRAIAVELPGHGYSEGPSCEQLTGYAEWLAEFAREAGLKDWVLCGHSMGGAIGQLFALANPGVLRGLVLVGTGSRLRVNPDLLAVYERNEVSFDFLRAAFSLHADEKYVQEEMDEYQYTGWKVRYLDFKACDQYSVFEMVHQIKIPTLVIVGREDRMTPVKFSQYLAGKIDGAKLVIVEGSGHYVMKEHPKETNQALVDFLYELT